MVAGTYQVVVTLQGFQTFTTQDVVVQANRVVRVDAKLDVGTVQESITVTAQQLLQTETAAVQTQMTREVIENIPVNGRSFQSLLVLTPGVAQPNYFQTGGINNPSRSMQISVNGAPNQNTVVRIDGVSATNQWIEGLQSYSPGMEAIETVNVTTSSFDADQGMAGGASVNVQVKSGTNAKGAGVQLPHDRGAPLPQLLPARRPGEGQGRQERLRRHLRRSDQEEQAVLLRQRRVHHAAQCRRPLRDAGVGVGDAVPVVADRRRFARATSRSRAR